MLARKIFSRTAVVLTQPVPPLAVGLRRTPFSNVSEPVTSSANSESAAFPTKPTLIERARSEDDSLIVTSSVLGSHRIAYKHDPALEKDDPYYAALADKDYFKTSRLFTMKQMVEARLFLGHKTGTLAPEMKQYLYGERLDVCIFDLDKTAAHLRSALNFLAHVAYRGGIVLFVTTDRWHVHHVEKAAKECGEYSHCHKYLKGTLTNSHAMFKHTVRFPDVIIFLSTLSSQLQQHALVKEAAKMQICTVGVVDSNCNPNLVTYPVPGNDDSLSSLKFYLHVFTEAIRLGKQKRREHFGVESRTKAELSQ